MSDRAFPIISVRCLPATRSFYEELGFSQTYPFPTEGEPSFVTMARGELKHRHPRRRRNRRDRFGYWVYVDDVDATLERLRAPGGPVVAEPEDQPWGERVAGSRRQPRLPRRSA